MKAHEAHREEVTQNHFTWLISFLVALVVFATLNVIVRNYKYRAEIYNRSFSDIHAQSHYNIAGNINHANIFSDNANDSKLTVENWMTELNTWATNYMAESPIKVEEWMTELNSWDIFNTFDESVKVESWMMELSSWGTDNKIEKDNSMASSVDSFAQYPYLYEESESPIEIESWMKDLNSWGSTVKGTTSKFSTGNESI